MANRQATELLPRIDSEARSPFWMSSRQINVTFKLFIVMLLIQFVILFGFKTEINTLGDELDYHNGGVLLANSLANGTFLSDAFDTTLFKYPGYYALAGIVYFIFGESPSVLRFIGVIPLFGLSVVAANIAALVAGERARIFCMLIVLFSPIFIFFSTIIVRDIYIAFALVIILHALILNIQANLSPLALLTRPVLLAVGLLFFFRFPQLIVTLTISFISLVLCWSFSLPKNKQRLGFLIAATLTAGSAVLSRGAILEMIEGIFFEGKENAVSTTQLSALADYSFNTPAEMLAALMNPVFVVTTFIAKLTALTLGPHPFARVELGGVNIYNLFSEFSTDAWGGYQWEDVLLVYGLQWIPQFVLLPFFAAGLVGISRFAPKVLISLGLVWVTYSIATIFSGNEVRWGLPNLIVYYLVTAIGYGWYGGRVKNFFLLSGGFFLSIIIVRVGLGVFIPMAVVPAMIIGLAFHYLNEPIGHHSLGQVGNCLSKSARNR